MPSTLHLHLSPKGTHAIPYETRTVPLNIGDADERGHQTPAPDEEGIRRY